MDLGPRRMIYRGIANNYEQLANNLETGDHIRATKPNCASPTVRQG